MFDVLKIACCFFVLTLFLSLLAFLIRSPVFKLGHYFVKRFFAPVLVSAVEDPVNNFTVWLVSDVNSVCFQTYRALISINALMRVRTCISI